MLDVTIPQRTVAGNRYEHAANCLWAGEVSPDDTLSPRTRKLRAGYGEHWLPMHTRTTGTKYFSMRNLGFVGTRVDLSEGTGS